MCWKSASLPWKAAWLAWLLLPVLPLSATPSRPWPERRPCGCQKTIYGGSYNLLEHTLPNFGITATFVDAHNLKEIEDAIQENTRLVYLETLGNPNADIPDLDAIAEIAHKHGLPVVVDNTFGTPYLIRPLEHGADIVVHSATKFIGGHGTSLGGIIVDGGKFDWAASGNYPAIAAPNPSYHGISFVDAAGPAAFVTYVRAHPAA